MRIHLWLLLSLFCAGITYLYGSRIVQPWEHYINVEHGTIKSEMGDLYSSWLGTRELLLHGRNPYGPEVTHEIQIAFYGHIIDQRYDQPGVDVIDEQRFAYPLYVVFFLAPTMRLDFASVQTWAPLIFALMTVLSLFAWLDLLRWRPSATIQAAIVLFVLSSPQVVQGLRLRQLGLLVGFLLAIAAWCISRNHFVAAGILLALSTLKPQMALLLIAWFIIWALGGLQKRWSLLAAFGVTLTVLLALCQLILPGWFFYFVNGMMAYRHYATTPSFLTLAFGSTLGLVLTGIALVGLLAMAWQRRKATSISWDFVYTTSLFCIATTFVSLRITPFNQILLLLPALIIVREWPTLPRAWRYSFAIIVAWPWITSLILLLFRPAIDSFRRVPLIPFAPSLLMPFVFLLLLSTRRIRGGTFSGKPLAFLLLMRALIFTPGE